MSFLSIMALSAGLAVVPAPVTNVARPSAATALSERVYPVDPDSFFRRARLAIRDTGMLSDNAVLRLYFTQVGVDLSPPSWCLFKHEEKSVLVNSTRENLNRIKALLPTPPPPSILFTRTYRIGSSDFFSGIRRLNIGVEGHSDVEVLRNFLRHKGVDLVPPASLFYSYGEKTLNVHATEKDLKLVERTIEEMSKAR